MGAPLSRINNESNNYGDDSMKNTHNASLLLTWGRGRSEYETHVTIISSFSGNVPISNIFCRKKVYKNCSKEL